ncbi:PTS transporter subunit EIIB [Kluyvera sp. STS39-E]|nr:PTS transporter subunit EIIB [Citrobacter sp. C1]RFU93588.1 hypothetical protein DZA29_02120 [Citrobacter gillenii]
MRDASHCITRLRLSLHNNKQAYIAELKALRGVLGRRDG